LFKGRNPGITQISRHFDTLDNNNIYVIIVFDFNDVIFRLKLMTLQYLNILIIIILIMPTIYIKDEVYNAFVKKYGIDNVKDIINDKLAEMIKKGEI